MFFRDGKAGQADLFHPLTRITPPRISLQVVRASSGASWPANPQEKKNWHLAAAGQRN